MTSLQLVYSHEKSRFKEYPIRPALLEQPLISHIAFFVQNRRCRFYIRQGWAGLLIRMVSYFMLQSNSFMDSFYSSYNNCFPVKLVVMNPHLNAVTHDKASPDWLRWRPFTCFQPWSVSKNKSICYFTGSRPQIDRGTFLLDLLLINHINVMLAHYVAFVCHAGT